VFVAVGLSWAFFKQRFESVLRFFPCDAGLVGVPRDQVEHLGFVDGAVVCRWIEKGAEVAEGALRGGDSEVIPGRNVWIWEGRAVGLKPWARAAATVGNGDVDGPVDVREDPVQSGGGPVAERRGGPASEEGGQLDGQGCGSRVAEEVDASVEAVEGAGGDLPPNNGVIEADVLELLGRHHAALVAGEPSQPTVSVHGFARRHAMDRNMRYATVAVHARISFPAVDRKPPPRRVFRDGFVALPS
jgi:hypothetical protein